MTRHPLPEPTLFARTCYVLAIGVALLAVSLLAACGKPAPMAPPVRPDGPCWVFKVLPLNGGGTVTLRAHYAICPSDSTLNALDWKREK